MTRTLCNNKTQSERKPRYNNRRKSKNRKISYSSLRKKAKRDKRGVLIACLWENMTFFTIVFILSLSLFILLLRLHSFSSPLPPAGLLAPTKVARVIGPTLASHNLIVRRGWMEKGGREVGRGVNFLYIFLIFFCLLAPSNST